MKKTLSVICVLFYLSFLVSCDPGENYLDKDALLANTVKIELYDYKNENPKLLNVDWGETPKFDFKKATLIATLDESRFEDILNDIAGEYLLFGTALNEPMGKTLVLHQKNGNMIVLFGCTYTNEYDKTYYYGDCYLFDKNGALLSI